VIKMIYKFAIFLMLITFLTCMANGISLMTCAIRSLIVFIGVLFFAFIAGYALQFSLYLTTQNSEESKTS